MPTPMPTIEAVLVTYTFMSVTPARKYSTPRVTPRLTRASMIGRPAATRLVKASSSTMRVIGKLTRSACSRSWRGVSVIGPVKGGAPPLSTPDPGGDPLDDRLEGGVVDRPGLVVDGDQGGGRELVGEALLEVALDGQRLGAGHLEPARPEPVGEPGGIAGHDGQ